MFCNFKKCILLFSLVWSPFCFAQFSNYTVGSGSKFTLSLSGQNVDVVISVAAVKKNQLNIEMLFNQMGKPMWQQFELSRSPSGAIEVNKGYVYFHSLPTPEILTSEYLTGYSGVQMNSFLFADAKSFKGQYIGEEKIKIAAGTTLARHFRHQENGQTIDYWISNEAKPIGLVKLESKGSKLDQNYTMTLAALVKNVKAKIDPKIAKPLSQKAKDHLPDPKTVQLLRK